MPRQRKLESPVPGTFHPVPPDDLQDVLRLFAVAARAVCARPDKLEEVTHELGHSVCGLEPPMLYAAQECARLWSFFARAASSPKPSLRLEAGKAFYRDVDSLGQQLDVPPLAAWEELPLGLDYSASKRSKSARRPAPLGMRLDEVKQEARARLRRKGKETELPPKEVAELLMMLEENERTELLRMMVGAGHLGRSESSLLERWARKGGDATSEDEALNEAFAKAATALLAD